MDALWQFFNDDVRESAALLDARMVLFFESRHASLLVRGLLPELGLRLMVSFDATRRLPVLSIPLPVACCLAIEFVRGSGSPKLVREPFGNHERGARVCFAFDLFQPHGSRTPRSWTAGAALGSQKGCPPVSVPRPAVLGVVAACDGAGRD